VQSVTELFAPPEEIQKILARPFAEWTVDDYERVFAWLHELPRRAYLREMAARVFEGTTVEDIDAVVEAFYFRRARRLLRKAQFKNVGALLLVDFDRYLRASASVVSHASKPAPLEDRVVGVESPVPQTGTGSGSLEQPGRPARRPLPRLSSRDRMLLAWTSSEPPATEGEREGDWVEATVFGPRKVA
jgi:hypothetical protein